MKFTKNMTEGNIYKSFLLYAIPLLISSLLSQAYSTIDAVIAGKFISENALGAISATGSYDLLLYSLFNGFAAGFGIYIAQQFGKGDFTTVKQDIVSNGVFVSVLTLIISVLSVLLRDPIMDYLKVDPILRADAEIYFIIYTMGYVLPYLNFLLIQALYSLGCTSFSLYVSFITAAFKIVGNLLSVLVFDFGVAGLAFVSVLSNGAATVCYLILLNKAFRELASEKTAFGFRFSGIKNSLKYALPAAVQQVAFHGVGLLIAPSVNGLSAAATTGYNVSNRVYNLATVSLWSVTNAFTCYTAQCVGQGDTKKIPGGLKAGFILNCLMLFPFVLGFAIFAKPLTSIFFPAGFVGDAYEYAVLYTAVYLPFVYVQLIGHILHSYMRSLGSVNTVLGITLFGSVIRVASTVLLVPVMHIEGAYLGQIISWAADAVVSVIIVFCLYRTQDQLGKIVERVRRHSVSTEV